MRLERSSIVAYWAGIAMLVAGALGFHGLVERFNVHLRKEPVPLRRPLDSVPTKLGRWERVGKDRIYTDLTLEELGTKSYLDRVYAVDGDPELGTLHVHVAYYTGTIDAVPHIPERCWAVGGLALTSNSQPISLAIDTSSWSTHPDRPEYRSIAVVDPITADLEDVTMPIGDTVVTTVEFQDPKHPETRQVGGYFFIANGRSEASSYGVRRAAFNLTDRYAYYCKIQITKSGQVDSPDASLIGTFTDDATDLLTHLIPQIMRCLPDWPTWQAGPARTTARPQTALAGGRGGTPPSTEAENALVR